ncbi:hypothetical protein [Actinoplanes sp. NPDC051851]|uniref:hypothetical protein n=1 Tax=Actinoplanes sp. NPDC051851 TaxID=3154753 RepID=UPI0034121327
MKNVSKGISVAAAAACAFLLLPATAARASSLGYQLDPGDTLGPGRSISSPNGLYRLTMQDDGNLVEYGNDDEVLGDTHSAGHPGTVLFMQNDGNLVLRAPGNVPIWATRTDGHPGTVLQIQDDGAVVMYSPGHQALHVIVPTLDHSSVATPHLDPVEEPELAPNTTTEEVGEAVYDGSRLIGCAAVGKLAEKLPSGGKVAGIVLGQTCGMATEKGPARIDGYGVFRMGVSVLAGPFGPAWDILSDAPPAG